MKYANIIARGFEQRNGNYYKILQTIIYCKFQVFSHSTNTKEVDSSITNKLLRVNKGETDYCGINLIYKDTSAPYFMACPGNSTPL